MKMWLDCPCMFTHMFMMLVTGCTGTSALNHVTLPNFAVVVADDVGWNDVGFHNKQRQTPHLNALAATGIRLEQHHVFMYCAPTRASLLSGRYPYHTTQTFPELLQRTPDGRGHLPFSGLQRAYVLLPALLKLRGYSSHQYGKWHQGWYRQELTPTGRGFDTSSGFVCDSDFCHKDHWVDPGKAAFAPCIGTNWWESNQPPATNVSGINVADHIAAHAVATIRSAKPSQPLYLHTEFWEQHAPIQEDERWVSLYDPAVVPDECRRISGAMVSHLDAAVFNITAALQETGRWRNTIFVFLSDNGGDIRPHGGTNCSCGPSNLCTRQPGECVFRQGLGACGSNAPLRGGKFTLFQGGTRYGRRLNSPARAFN